MKFIKWLVGLLFGGKSKTQVANEDARRDMRERENIQDAVEKSEATGNLEDERKIFGEK